MISQTNEEYVVVQEASKTNGQIFTRHIRKCFNTSYYTVGMSLLMLVTGAIITGNCICLIGVIHILLVVTRFRLPNNYGSNATRLRTLVIVGNLILIYFTISRSSY